MWFVGGLVCKNMSRSNALDLVHLPSCVAVSVFVIFTYLNQSTTLVVNHHRTIYIERCVSGINLVLGLAVLGLFLIDARSFRFFLDGLKSRQCSCGSEVSTSCASRYPRLAFLRQSTFKLDFGFIIGT